MKRAVIIVAVLAALIAFAVPAGAVTQPPGRLLILGDSLTQESTNYLTQQAAKHKGWGFHVRAFGGTAPCDWTGWLTDEITTFHPTVVAIETAGNSTRPCMGGVTAGSPEFWAEYQTDLTSLITTAEAAGAHVVLIDPPPMADPAWNTRTAGITTLMHSLGVQYQASEIVNVRSTFGGTVYTPSKKCLATETAAKGCVNGMIFVRTQAPALDAGIHFCPTGIDASFGCAIYSSGEYRYSQVVVAGMVNPPAVKLR